jgi:hypothetical protein
MTFVNPFPGTHLNPTQVLQSISKRIYDNFLNQHKVQLKQIQFHIKQFFVCQCQSSHSLNTDL